MLVDELLEESKDALAHYGIKGQKWGLRRFQNEDGTYTELGKERRRVGYTEPDNKEDEKSSKGKKSDTDEFPGEKIGGKAYKDMTKKELRAAKKRARHNEAERRERREFNRDKAQAIEDGNLSFISKNINKFTNDEIDVAIRRYNKMKELKDLEKSTQKPEGYYFDKAIRFLDRTAKASKSIADIANNFNDIKKKNEERKQAEINTRKLAKPKEETWDDKTKKYDLERKKKKDEEADKEAKEKKAKEEKEAKEKKAKEEKEEAEKKSKAAKEELKKAEAELKKAKEDEEDRLIKVRTAEAAAQKAEYEAKLKQAEWEKNQDAKSKQEAEEAEKKAKKAQEEYEKGYAEYKAKMEKEEKAAEELARAVAKARQEEEAERYWNEYRNTMYMLPDFPYGNAKIGGLFLSKKDKKAYNKYWNEVKEGFKDNVLDLDNYNAKMLANNAKKLEEYYKYYFDTTQLGSLPKAVARDKKGEPKFTNTRDIRWYKESKQGEADKIDDWVKEMAEKYEKEHGYSKAVAREKAEDYVDYWLDLYGKKKR